VTIDKLKNLNNGLKIKTALLVSSIYAKMHPKPTNEDPNASLSSVTNEFRPK
jgi:hypothetical protein